MKLPDKRNSPPEDKDRAVNNVKTKEGQKPQHYYSVEPKIPINIHRVFLSIGPVSFSLDSSTGVFSYEKIDKGTLNLLKFIRLPPSLNVLLSTDEGKDLSKPEGPINILDLGAGYGPISIYLEKYIRTMAAESGSIEGLEDKLSIYAIEINKRAVWLLKKNIRTTQCSLVKPIRADFLDYSEFERNNIFFDAIYINPPLKLGHPYMLEIFNKAINLLKKDGILQYVHKKTLGAEGFLSKLKNSHPDLHYYIVKKVSGYFIILISRTPYLDEGT